FPVGLSLSVILAMSLAITLMRVTGTKEDIFYLIPTRAWEMLAGGLVYIALMNPLMIFIKIIKLR
ncbi:hypothetical protein GL10_24105, partial [Salmonella enterica subsp. enterica serovar Dublin]|nr:hypothetical protein [Salmonella enterica subsp. enterica serovar Dublin]